MISSEQWAYAAGIIDGEGSIHTQQKNQQTPTVSVSVQMTDIRVINHLHAVFGGGVYAVRRLKPTTLPQGGFVKNARPQYIWRLSARTTTKFLNGIMPYLIVKRTQAELALALRALIGRRGLRVPLEKQVAASELRHRISVINRTGTDPMQTKTT